MINAHNTEANRFFISNPLYEETDFVRRAGNHFVSQKETARIRTSACYMHLFLIFDTSTRIFPLSAVSLGFATHGAVDPAGGLA